MRRELRAALEADGHAVEDYASGPAFLDAYRPGAQACLLIDAYMPGLNGIDVLGRLRHVDRDLPAIMITGDSDVSMAVDAMKAGAIDFIEKPVSLSDLLAGVERALDRSRNARGLAAPHDEATAKINLLTPRQRTILDLVIAGAPSKIIAADLGISQRTVENHRAAIMKKTGTKSLTALARLAFQASDDDSDEPRS